MNQPAATQSEAVPDQPFTLRDLDESEAVVVAVQAAIDALDNGSYGTCKVCGNDLTATLEHDPLALTCNTHLALA